eukprot:445558-Pleurochrysis_carterae.AAC.3
MRVSCFEIGRGNISERCRRGRDAPGNSASYLPTNLPTSPISALLPTYQPLSPLTQSQPRTCLPHAYLCTLPNLLVL